MLIHERLRIHVGLLGTLVLTAGQAVAGGGSDAVRPALFAGSWYPGDRAALTSEVDGLLAGSCPAKLDGRPVGLIAPHAGYRFSAPVAAAGYRCLRGYAFKRVIVLAFSHRHAGSYQGVDAPKEFAAYETPLGQVPIDRPVVEGLLAKPGFTSVPGMHRDEHSLELQLPFLQRVLGEFRLVPLLVGRMSAQDYALAAEAILPWVDENTLLVVSSDFTHFGPNYGYEPEAFKKDPANQLRQLADQAAEPLVACDFDGFAQHLSKTGDTICGQGPIALLLRILSMQGGAQGVRAAFDTSGHITGDWTNSVTYQSIVFTRRRGTLQETERSELLRLARQTVTAYLKRQKLPEVEAGKLPAALRANGACFVTLKNHGELRGCIGNMEAQGPLYEAVRHNAVQACRDYRFVTNPVTAGELNQIDIEISYLTPMKQLKDSKEIIVGRHGLLIELGDRHGVLLPQVAYELGWTREEFLGQTCRKAGLPLDAWKRPDAKLYSFEAEVFGEPKPGMSKPAS